MRFSAWGTFNPIRYQRGKRRSWHNVSTVHFYSKTAHPISETEFATMFRDCMPPTGWPTTIGTSLLLNENRILTICFPAVANSGGPDSTCLLFLINRYLRDPARISSQDCPRRLLSMTVNHGLQLSSDSMAARCEQTANAMCIPHITSTVPWSRSPFPNIPSPGESYERIARDVRYSLLFQAMLQENADVLACGHHVDDQVETMLMRLGRNTTELGAGGMRPCRRWGMGLGSQGSLGWAGKEGMKRWIIRPLLTVSKVCTVLLSLSFRINVLFKG